MIGVKVSINFKEFQLSSYAKTNSMKGYILLDIGSWWQSLNGFDKIFWFIALLFSLFFVIQTILSFAGGDGDDSFGDADASVEGDTGISYGFLTIKNFIAFFTIFGWTGVALSGSSVGKIWIIIFAFLGGCVVVAMMVFLMNSMSKLKESGTLKMENALGKTGTVYLHIPAARKGAGKITITVQGAMRELNAITNDDKDISTGSLVKVTEVAGDNLLGVTRI